MPSEYKKKNKTLIISLQNQSLNAHRYFSLENLAEKGLRVFGVTLPMN